MQQHTCDWCDHRATHSHITPDLTVHACVMHKPAYLLVLERMRNLDARARRNPYASLDESDAIARGLRIMPPLPCCGWTYGRDTLIAIGRGQVKHDDTPTHLCGTRRQYVSAASSRL